MIPSYSDDLVEYPFSLEWTIPKDRLKALKNSTKNECLKTDIFTAFKFSPIPFHFELYPNGNNDKNRGKVWIFLQIPFEHQSNIYANLTFSIETADWKKHVKHLFNGEFDRYGIRICVTQDFFLFENEFFLDGKCTIRVDGIFKTEKKKSKWINGNLNLWKSGSFDFSFKIGQKEFRAHESVFSSQSPLFAAMFERMKDENEKIIELPDFTFDIVSLAVKLCYDRKLVPQISSKKAFLLLKFADVYEIPILKENLEMYLCDKISVTNVCEFVVAAKETNTLKLQNNCFDFLFDKISKKKCIPNIKQLEKEFANDLFQKSLCNETSTHFVCK